jgi:hypothetical protein
MTLYTANTAAISSPLIGNGRRCLQISRTMKKPPSIGLMMMNTDPMNALMFISILVQVRKSIV